MHIKPIEDKQTWETFVRRFHPNNFLQSWNFGRFNDTDGDPPRFLGAYEDETLIGVGLFIHTQARRGNYYACAAGPLVLGVNGPITGAFDDPADAERYRRVLSAFVDFLKSQGDAAFVRIRPGLLNQPEHAALFARAGFRPSPLHLHAERSWLLDIAPDEDAILAQMRKNTRYYVKRAAKDGVTVRMSQDDAAVETLHRLQAETVARQQFVPFSLTYFRRLFAAFKADDQAVMFTAYVGDTPIAAAMINYYGDQAVYHYAASDSAHSKLPAAYAILWEAILEGKRRGCRWFNFWGVVGDDQENHPWFGLSRFKKGFGGEEVWYLHAHDYPLSWRYWPVWALETWRRRKRGL